MSGVIRRTPNEIAFDNVALRTEESALRVNGTVHNIEGGSPVVDLKASSDKLALNEIARLVPALARLRAAAGVRGHGDRARPIGWRSIWRCVTPRLGDVTADADRRRRSRQACARAARRESSD